MGLGTACPSHNGWLMRAARTTVGYWVRYSALQIVVWGGGLVTR